MKDENDIVTKYAKRAKSLLPCRPRACHIYLLFVKGFMLPGACLWSELELPSTQEYPPGLITRFLFSTTLTVNEKRKKFI